MHHGVLIIFLGLIEQITFAVLASLFKPILVIWRSYACTIMGVLLPFLPFTSYYGVLLETSRKNKVERRKIH